MAIHAPFTFAFSRTLNYTRKMDFIEQEERLEGAGFNREQAREILRVVNAGDTQAMTKADGQEMERQLRIEITSLRTETIQRFEAVDARFDAMDQRHQARFRAADYKYEGKFQAIEIRFKALDAKLDAMTQKLISTAWTVGGVAVGILVAIRYFG